MISQVDDRQRRLAEISAQLNKRALHMSNGKLAYKIGPHQYAYIDDDGNETVISEPNEQEEAERRDKEQESKGIKTATGFERRTVVEQSKDLRHVREKLERERAAVAANGPPAADGPDPKSAKDKLTALESQTDAAEGEANAAMARVDSTIAAVGELNPDYKCDPALAKAKVDRFDALDDSPPSQSSTIGRSISVAEEVSPSSLPGKGHAVEAFTVSASRQQIAPAEDRATGPSVNPPANKGRAYSDSTPS